MNIFEYIISPNQFKIINAYQLLVQQVDNIPLQYYMSVATEQYLVKIILIMIEIQLSVRILKYEVLGMTHNICYV